MHILICTYVDINIYVYMDSPLPKWNHNVIPILQLKTWL